jgi:hypothetical protein
LNRYAYCRNNPLIYVDPSGHFGFLGFIAAIFIGAAVGAAVGGIMAAINGGDIWEGITQGAISGAISGAMFYCAGAIIRGGELFTTAEITSNVAKGAIHTVTGALSGAVNAAISGGDIGQAALTGALSAGMAKYIGGEKGLDMLGRMAVGTVTGGVSSVMAGGDFVEGAIQGAWTSAIAHIVNEGGKKLDAAMRKLIAEYSERNKIRNGYEELAESNRRIGDPSPDAKARAEARLKVIKEEFRFHPERVESYLRSEYVQGQFRVFSDLALTSPTQLLGIDYAIQNWEGGSESTAIILRTYGGAIKSAIKRK